jgi:hypothetical protein
MTTTTLPADEKSLPLAFPEGPIRRNKQRFGGLISPGISEALSAVMFHNDAPLERRRFCGQGLHPAADLHVAVHEIKGVRPALNRSYCEPHTHNCSELNLLLSFERLVFRITLGDESYICQAPSSIFIPAGLSHSANVVEGTGFFVVILGSSDYLRSLDDTIPADQRAAWPERTNG